MNTYRMFGFVCGIIVGLIIVVLVMKFMHRDGCKTQYDERQQTIRGRGYQYGFVAMAIMTAVKMAIGVGEIELPLYDAVADFIVLALGIVVAVSYFVWNEAYWGLNTSQPRFYLVMVLATLLNIFPVVGAGMAGELIVDGKMGIAGINLVCAILCVALLIQAGIKAVLDRKAGEE